MNYLTKNGGITSTSANYLCNLAKEDAEEARQCLSSINFLNTEVELLDGTNKKRISSGINNLKEIQKALEKIQEANSFCAYIREAIKEKENLLNELKRTTLNDFITMKNLSPLEEVTKFQPVTDEEIFNSWDIKKKTRYLEVEAKAAAIGKVVHPNGAFNSARKVLAEKLKKPYSTSGEGKDMVIYHYTPSINISEVNDGFMKLQNEYRSLEKELNSYKAELLEKKNEEEYKRNQEYKEKYNAFDSHRAQLCTQFNEYVIERREEISSLKINVPVKFAEYMEYLNSLSKAN